MAIRTDDDQVKGVLLSDYGPKTDGTLPSLAPFIRAANIMANKVSECATVKNYSISTEELTEIETWLAAHFYAMSDQPYSEKRTERAIGKFQGVTGMALDASKYGQMAKMLDTSGCLTELANRRVVKGFWAGTPDRDAQTYDERND